jgi:hypothetical protein
VTEWRTWSEAPWENVLDCKLSSQEKWSSGLREASPTNHNGDVPNGYVQRACTPLRWWWNQIPIFAIPILAIHSNQDPNFSNPNCSDPDLGDELKESGNWHSQKKSAKNARASISFKIGYTAWYAQCPLSMLAGLFALSMCIMMIYLNMITSHTWWKESALCNLWSLAWGEWHCGQQSCCHQRCNWHHG